jgi:membrane protease YdiL (CAAX protease family)
VKDKIKNISNLSLLTSHLLALTEIIIIYLSVNLIISSLFGFTHAYDGFILLAGMFLPVILWERGIKKIPFKETGMTVPEDFIYELITAILLLLIIICYNFLLPYSAKINNLTVILNISFILNCFLTSLSEEFFYRAILLKKMVKVTGRLSGTVIISIVFSFICHSGAGFTENLIWRFPISLILSYLYLRKNNLFMPVTVHLIVNLLFS